MKKFLVAAALLVGGAAHAAPVVGPSRDIHVSTPVYEFEYTYPEAAGRIPALKAWLDKDAATQQARIAAEGREGFKEAKSDRRDYVPYDAETTWQVVTDLPDWLSLSGVSGSYTGGAHPNHWPVSLLWDKARGRQIGPADLFVSKAELSKAIRQPFCVSLDRQRAQNRGERIDPKSKKLFENCLNPVEQVVILGSADHAHFTRIGILMGPYAAGPYVEGDYEVTLPVTQAVLSAVRPEYRGDFALAGSSPTKPPQTKK
jgi:hypothetical protein